MPVRVVFVGHSKAMILVLKTLNKLHNRKFCWVQACREPWVKKIVLLVIVVELEVELMCCFVYCHVWSHFGCISFHLLSYFAVYWRRLPTRSGNMMGIFRYSSVVLFDGFQYITTVKAFNQNALICNIFTLYVSYPLSYLLNLRPVFYLPLPDLWSRQ